VRFAVERMPVKELARQTGLSPRGLYKLRHGLNRPRDGHRATLQSLAAEWVCQQLTALGSGSGLLGIEARELLALYRHRIDADERRARIHREHSDARRERHRELYRAIRALGGIARHRDGDLGEEYRRITRSLRSSRGVQPDEMAAMLAEHYPWLGITCEGDLYQLAEEYHRLATSRHDKVKRLWAGQLACSTIPRSDSLVLWGRLFELVDRSEKVLDQAARRYR